eukprot:11824-Heterococcus_DN1.PRE.2
MPKSSGFSSVMQATTFESSLTLHKVCRYLHHAQQQIAPQLSPTQRAACACGLQLHSSCCTGQLRH